MWDHVGFQCSDMTASAAFYDAVLGVLGEKRVMEFEVPGFRGVGYGTDEKPYFWISTFNSGEGFRESHIAFAAADRATVDAFFEAAVGLGAEVLHEPRFWPEYHPG